MAKKKTTGLQESIVTMDVADMKPAAYNPRTMSDHDYMQLLDSMATEGNVDLPLVNKDGTVIAGHQRLKAAKELGWEKMTVIQVNVSKTKKKNSTSA